MTTEHEEGFAAGIEAAARVAEKAGWFITADDIRALKPAPRSAKHTAEPSAQGERERFEALVNTLVHAHLGFYKSFNYQRCKESVDAVRAAFDAALATAPSTRIEAEPVAVVVNNNVPGERMHLIRSAESHATLAVGAKLYLAPPDRTPDARSTSDAAVETELERAIELYREAVEHDFRQKATIREPAARNALNAATIAADRATRSTDSSAEAVGGNALRDEFEQWYVENAFDYERNPLGSGLCGQQWFAYAGARGFSRMEANGILLLRYTLNFEANEAAKLTTAPHTADETRVDGEKQ